MSIWTGLYALLGTVIGSFLNVCIDRLPEDKSIVFPPSHCPHCQRQLQPLELIPIFSYLALQGRCRTCEGKIPLRVLGVELGTGILFGLIWQRVGLGVEGIMTSLYSTLLILMGTIDLEHQRVLNKISYPAIALALIAIPIFHADNPWKWVVGGLVGFGTLFLISLISPQAMGMGDIKLTFFIGLILGYPEIILSLFLAFVIGGSIAGLLLLLDKIGSKDPIAFGPFLALGGIITLLYGGSILTWWLRRIGL
ncbi:MAG: prepilin peptidase [Anaerolineales bacterium]